MTFNLDIWRLVRPMSIRLLIALLVISIWHDSASAATIEQAWRTNGRYSWAIKVEGDIVPGDADKLLTKLMDFFYVFGPAIDTIYLMSKGGDVEEAMKMGAIIRRLRLGTMAPIWQGNNNEPPFSPVLPDNKDNLICASACFLIYAGGVDRFGNYLALHRPYLSRAETSKLSDIEYEAAQKKETIEVSEYLKSMDIDQYWIDRMMATSSQDSYVVPWSEADNKVYHLMGTVPLIEEIELGKCTAITPEEFGIIGLLSRKKQASLLTVEEQSRLTQETTKMEAFFDCEKKVLEGIRNAAYEREVEKVPMPECVNLTAQENQTMVTLITLSKNGTQLAAKDESLKEQLLLKYFKFNDCKNDVLKNIRGSAWKREADDMERMDAYDKSKQPPPSVNEVVGLSFAEKSAVNGQTPTASTEAFKGVTAAYDRGDYPAALRLIKPLADQGNVEAQTLLGRMYQRGDGVTKDHAEAARWYRKAAEQGYAKAQDLLADIYKDGDGVPKDYTEALKLYRAAADQGDADAQTSLANMYGNGDGVTRDDAESVKWWRKAAEQGHAIAQYAIGAEYEFGGHTGVPQDNVQAYKWYSLSIQASSDFERDTFTEARDRVAAEMTQQQIAEAQQLAAAWKPTRSGAQ